MIFSQVEIKKNAPGKFTAYILLIKCAILPEITKKVFDIIIKFPTFAVLFVKGLLFLLMLWQQ